MGVWYVGTTPFFHKESAERHVAILKAIENHTRATIERIKRHEGN